MVHMPHHICCHCHRGVLQLSFCSPAKQCDTDGMALLAPSATRPWPCLRDCRIIIITCTYKLHANGDIGSHIHPLSFHFGRADPKWGVELANDPPATAGLLANFRQTHTFEAPGLFHVLNDQSQGPFAGETSWAFPQNACKVLITLTNWLSSTNLQV